MIANLQIGNAKIIETGNRYGNMNTAAAFYPMNYTLEKRKQEFMNARMKLGNDYGFDGHKMFMADQEHKKGTYFEITEDYVEANPNGWTDIAEDILVVAVPDVVIGHPVADCPVVMAYDKVQNVLAIGHCSADLIDSKMPELVGDALLKSHGSKDEDIAVYVSACAGKEYAYNKYPDWARDEKVWEDAINEGKDGLFHIDLKTAILKQLKTRNIQDIRMSLGDTILDPDYYSNSAYKKGNKEKKGRNFAGAFIKKR